MLMTESAPQHTTLTKSTPKAALHKDAQTTASTRQAFIAPDGGFTSVGVAIALLLALTLLFSAAQVRWVQSQSADIQFVADSGALAGANIVGEYMVIARIADAVVLSLSLLGMTVYGVAIVVSCIPYMQSVGAELMQFGAKVFKARDDCADTAAAALNKLQAALPFLIAANAAATIEANSGISASPASYHGLAIPLPLEGEDVTFPDDDAAQNSNEALAEQNEQTAEFTDAAQDAFEKMESTKLRAYLADCGNKPNYCMYERAEHLAGLKGAQNPYFSSVETWLFDYAFKRAEAYYAKRLSSEQAHNQTLDEQVRTFCRERFYTYAVAELDKGWCKTSPDGVIDAHFPLFPKNTDEVRQSSLYTENVYPLSADGVLHGSPACPSYQSAGGAGKGSVEGLESGSHSSCSECNFAASTIGKVASASTSIDNGFEYHYRIVAEAAKEYQEASREYEEKTREAKESGEKSFDIFEEAMQALKAPRIVPRPPGHNGVIALVIDWESHAIPAGFTNPAVSNSGELQARMALSAAALAEEKAHENANILASFLDKAQADADAQGSSLSLSSLGVFDDILSVWGSALLVYSQGGDAINQGLTEFLDGIPLVKSTPLSRWAQNALSETIDALGLQGADMDTPKPLIVNSMHVLRASDTQAAQGLLSAKEAYSSLGGSGSGTLGGAMVEGLTSSLYDKGAEWLETEFVLYEISFGDNTGLPRIPITLRLPEGFVQRGQSALQSFTQGINNTLGGGGSNAIWE